MWRESLPQNLGPWTLNQWQPWAPNVAAIPGRPTVFVPTTQQLESKRRIERIERGKEYILKSYQELARRAREREGGRTRDVCTYLAYLLVLLLLLLLFADAIWLAGWFACLLGCFLRCLLGGLQDLDGFWAKHIFLQCISMYCCDSALTPSPYPVLIEDVAHESFQIRAS